MVFERDGTQLAHYRKMHIPDDPAFYEKFYFAPGDLGFHAVDTSAGRIGVLICWDQWFPEAARLLALDGAEMLFYPTAIGYLDAESDAENAAMRDSWQTVQRGHAIANGVFVCAREPGRPRGRRRALLGHVVRRGPAGPRHRAGE